MLDLLIIGGSAAGVSASIYAARRKLNFRLISEDFGGEVATSGEIWNYPGFPQTDGITLSEKFKEHLTANDVEPELGYWVESITKTTDGTFDVVAKKGSDKETIQAKTVIVTTGVHPRHLNIPGEDDLRGRGVTYCTTCDGPLFKNKRVVTIGGGNSAMESVLMLASIAEHVTLVTKNSALKGENVLMDKIAGINNIDIIYNAATTAIVGENVVEAIEYTDTESGQQQTLPTQGVFVHIGLIPNSDMMPSDVVKNKFKEVEVGRRAETTVEGLFAAGDLTNVPYKQIAIATGQGVTAALSAIEYLNKQSS